MVFEIQITTGSTVPIYKQIFDQVRFAVATGALQPGVRLPSVRAQAERLLVNPNTVARAYGDLVREGVLRSEQGRGVFVDGARPVYRKSERRRRLQPALEAFVKEALALSFRPGEIRAMVERKLAQVHLRDTQPGDESG